jgi:hypothetical protein
MVLVCWTGDMEIGQMALAPLRALAEPVADVVAPIPYPVIYEFTANAAAPHGASIRSMFANDVSDQAIEDIIEAMGRATSPVSMVQFRGFGGAMARVDAGATAFAHRDKRYQVTVLGLWLDAAEDPAPHRAWVESLWDQIRGEGLGCYVNFLEREGDDRIREAYSPATLARLTEIKRMYDPRNMFRYNQNIAPR